MSPGPPTCTPSESPGISCAVNSSPLRAPSHFFPRSQRLVVSGASRGRLLVLKFPSTSKQSRCQTPPPTDGPFIYDDFIYSNKVL